MNSFFLLWIYIVALQKTALSQDELTLTPDTKLDISTLHNQVKTIRSDVDLLTIHSMERMSRVDGQMTTLVKAFKDEKLFYRDKMDELTDYQTDSISKIEKLESEELELNVKQEKDRENHEAYIKKNENDMAMFRSRINEIGERIEELESDNVFLNASVNNWNTKSDSDMEEIRQQQNAFAAQIKNLEAKYQLIQDKLNGELLTEARLAKECGSSWKVNNNYCFLFISKKRTWNEAVTFCKDKGARLVEISNANIHAQVQRMVEENGADWGEDKWDGFWAGGSFNGWKWIWEGSQTDFGWTNWYPGEPGNNRNHLVVMINRNYRWDDQYDWQSKPFICEKIITLS